jgi:hypothetical protein
MNAARRARPSPAIVIACIALLVSLTGTSIAAVEQLARNSVGTPQLKRGAVSTAKLKRGAVSTAKLRNNAVTSAKVRNGSLLRADFRAGQIPAGPQGPAGAQGPQGPVGPSTAYHARFDYLPAGTALSASDFTTLHTLNLPAGSYAAIGTTTAKNNGGGNDAVLCEVVPSTGSIARYVGSAVPGQFAEVSGTVAFTLASPGTVLLRCIGNVGAGAMVRNQSTLTAIRVGEVVQQ